MRILVTGSLAFDQIMNFPGSFADHIMPDKLHVLSVSFVLNQLHKNYGGTAGNISYNLGLLNKEPICVASTGNDAQDYKSFLEKNGVDTRYIATAPKEYTASSVVITDQKDCQIAGFYPGAMNHDTQLSLYSVVSAEKLEASDVFVAIAPTQADAMVKNVNEAIGNHWRYLYSPAQQIPYISAEDLRNGVMGAEIIIGNDYELAQLEQKSGVSKVEMMDRGAIIVTTFADRGSSIEKKDREEIMIGIARPREIKDPTGSGDAYIAGFLAAYMENKTLVECGQWAATAAVYAVEAYGTTGHSFSMNIFENRLHENFG